jgi:HPt (histidine-containing phosphotransfer) domain-containing protein
MNAPQGKPGQSAKPSEPVEALTERTPMAAPAFCLDEALARVAGETELLRQIAGYFLDDAPKQLAAMRAALERNDLPAIGRAAHRLRGTVIYLGAAPALAVLAQLEEAAGSVDPRAAARRLEELAPKLAALTRALTSYLAGEDDSPPA